MEYTAGRRCGGLAYLPDQVDHSGIAQGLCWPGRLIGHGKHVVAELAGSCALNRPVPGIVYPGGKLVGE